MNNNGFTALRLLAAYLVILTHSFVLLHAGPDNLAEHGLPQWSDLGVTAFFSISGYLICKALQRNPNPIGYLRNRALRIFPGLFVLLAITIFVVGPQLSPKGYWSNDPLWYFQNLSLYLLSPYLPGVFQGNPVTVVNGSLWTLAHEATCYLLLLAISWAGALNWRTLLLVVAGSYVMHMNDMIATDAKFLGITAHHFLRLSLFFWSGAFLALITLPRNILIWTAACAITIAPFFIYGNSPDWHEKEWALKLLFPFILIFAAENTPKLAFLNKYDISYGIYIYSFLIQQILVAKYGTHINPKTLSIYTALIATPVAYLSWIFVEKPALRLKARAMPAPPPPEERKTSGLEVA